MVAGWAADHFSAAEVGALAETVEDTNGITFGSPLQVWVLRIGGLEAKGLCGITGGVTKAHLARAVLEGVALQNVDILTSMEKDLAPSSASSRLMVAWLATT